MREYRIIKVEYGNGTIYYKIQRRSRFFHIWKTYEDVYDGNWSSHDGWSYFLKLGDSFSNLVRVKEKLDELKNKERGKIIKSIEVVHE